MFIVIIALITSGPLSETKEEGGTDQSFSVSSKNANFSLPITALIQYLRTKIDVQFG